MERWGVKIILILFLLMGFTLTAYAQTPKHMETVRLNGIDTYYEVYGEGPPLIFLHGGGQSSTLWHEYVNDFADNFEVYLVDLLGHGRSSPLQVGMSTQSAHEPFLNLMDHLQIQQFSAVGYSLGAAVLLQVAIANPGRIDRMITVGHGTRYKNERVDFNFAEEGLKKISTETLIVAGERDRILGGSYIVSGNAVDRLELILQLHELIPKSHIWIVPNEGHRTFDGQGKPEFVRIANEFFRGEWE
jgi:pimeloyl-ACP methyl ester carboxylesterase